MSRITDFVTEKIKMCLTSDMRKQLSGNSLRTHKDIERFQNKVAKCFDTNATLGENIEKRLFDNSKDRADIWINNPNNEEYELIIEIDATRADQVAKKMLSRYCYSVGQEKPLIYVALLYNGTSSMNSEECKKYFQMGATVLRKLDERNILIGYIIGKDDDDVFVFSTPDTSVIYNDDSVYRRERYVQFLYEENVKSIDNYLMPLNKIETLENGERDDYIQKLSVSPKDRLDLISVRFGKTKKLTRNQKSYWNKYFKFLDSENKDATLEKERSFSR